MAYPIHGKVASILKNDVAAGSRIGFELNVELDMDDASVQGNDWKNHLPGMAGASGKMDFILDPSNTEQKALIDNIVAATPGTKLTDVEFALEDTDDYFSGDIFLTSFATVANISGKVTGSFNFVVDGALSLTIAA